MADAEATNAPQQKAARERILDAAASVMREKGIAAATTKQIARAAGYSEAMLYKHFDDKQQLFVSVLHERLPSYRLQAADDDLGVREGLEAMVAGLLRFYAGSFIIAVSVFGSPELLAAQRDGVRAHGAGPEGPTRAVSAYLTRERDAGALPAGFDPDAVATLLVGAALHTAFLAAFNGSDQVDDADGVAKRLVAAVLPADVK
ncbi:MAG TPA: TetR/AcrR family transcriptional regulator [Humibacter sp.]|jgi:AcrR family transcriptional regulator|nr:TetR/AcrR family transcriptional regulator [Humibacter sp.]